jgi:hypothetical protein
MLFVRPGRLLPAMASLSVSLALAATALADEAAPQPSLMKAPAPWLGLLVMFVLVAMVVAVSLMPSRRSHQD